jgi:hypothetical protein
LSVPFQTLSPRLQAWMAFHIVTVITVGLWLDANFGWTGQHIATIWAFAVWAWLYRLGGRIERYTLIFATVLSGLGEVFLSLVWGVYDYQFHNVPLFVPPGHALLMTLGLLIAMRIPPPRAAIYVWLITLAALSWGVAAWIGNTDRFGVMLFMLYLGCITFGRQKTLYATMFILALIMELYGTALGNWFWVSPAPWVHLSAANPPFSAGAFYCALDLLVLALLHATIKNSPIGGHLQAISVENSRQ